MENDQNNAVVERSAQRQSLPSPQVRAAHRLPFNCGELSEGDGQNVGPRDAEKRLAIKNGELENIAAFRETLKNKAAVRSSLGKRWSRTSPHPPVGYWLRIERPEAFILREQDDVAAILASEQLPTAQSINAVGFETYNEIGFAWLLCGS